MKFDLDLPAAGTSSVKSVVSFTNWHVGRCLFRSLFTTVLVVFVLVFAAGPAAAHTGFESSEPADGDVVDGPVDEIIISFSGESQPAGEGFVVLDSSGVVRAPDSVTPGDDLSWVLGFVEPLDEGVVGVRWSVQAPDAHPIDGSFSFTVSSAGSTQTTASNVNESPNGETSDNSTSVVTPEIVDLEAFLDTGDIGAPYASEVGTAGRAFGLIGTMIAIGGLVFASVVLRGSESDIRSVLKWVRRSGILVLAGAIIELGAQVGVGADDWSALQDRDVYELILRTDFGLAVSLRALGAIVLGFGALPSITDAATSADPVLAIKKRLHIGAGPHPTKPDHKGIVVGSNGEPYLHENDHAWRRKFLGSVFTLIVASPLLVSHIFDGHTASEGIRWLTATVDIVHVVTAATWAGGLLMMALVLWRRHRRGEDMRALQLAVRFSVIAAIALVLAGAAGIGLTVTILDTPSDLWSTPWGRLLIAKTAVVAVGAAAGGYNHHFLIPKMLDPNFNGKLDRKFRRSVTVEAFVLATVIVITAFLVGASST